MPEHAADGRGAGRAPGIDLEINAANLFGKLIQKKSLYIAGRTRPQRKGSLIFWVSKITCGMIYSWDGLVGC